MKRLPCIFYKTEKNLDNKNFFLAIGVDIWYDAKVNKNKGACIFMQKKRRGERERLHYSKI